eukprot:TRINITY_DN1860_c0_g1_i2.p1 TRINITY_DN1860_c0_g1~~TRINITY_DN1860_c0_g1_i2.p1  ORF type:complete len:1447 (+),score=367.26 TRINITY_DN1860_c0_g1_i2:45-4343(+)
MAPTAEEYFPRGKAKSTQKATSTTTDNKKIDKDEKLFVNIFSEKDGKIIKKKKKSVGKKKVSEKPVLAIKYVPSLNYSQLKEGMVMGAVVSEVSDYNIKVSLPCHLTASLSIANISSIFTDFLRKSTEDIKSEDEDLSDVPSLDQLFKVGQFLVVAISSIKQENNKYEVSVSTDPKLLMATRIPDVGDLCMASVISKEDHGYIMDIGSKTIRGFLPNKAAEKHWTKTICTGSVILCVITKKDGGAVTLKCEPGKVYNNLKSEVNLHNVLPGTVFNAKINTVLDNGLKVQFGKDLSGYVHKDLLPKSLSDYDIDAQINVRLVHVIPTMNTVLLSARDIWPFTNQFSDVKAGSLFENATIAEVNKNDLILTLTNSLRGYVSARHAQTDHNATQPLKERYKIGSTVRARALGLDHFSGQVVCTLHKDKVQGVTKIDHLKIGEKVKAEVKQFKPEGLEVKVGAVTGFIPTLYLSDVPLKHPEKKFLPGDKIDCKVIKVNPERKRLHLTSKPYMVKNEFSIISSIDEAEEGVITEGVVAKISKAGLLINLMGEARGWAPASELSTEPVEFPEKIFWIGQSVKCRVKAVNPEKNSITLSLVINGANTKPSGKKGSLLKLGNFYKAQILKVTTKGLDVEVNENGVSIGCRIPVYHLSDNLSLASNILECYKEGDDIEALCFVHEVIPILTLKPSICQAAKSSNCVHSWESISVGSILPAVVKSTAKIGIFMNLPIWESVRCFVPIRHVSNFYVDSIQDIIEEGQTLMVKVLEKSESGKKEILGTTNVEEVNVNSSDSTVEMVQNLLGDFHFLRSHSSGKLAKLTIGDKITAKVKELTDMGAILEAGGLMALAPASNLGSEKPVPGNKISVIVLFIDYQMGVLEVSCDQSFVKKHTETKDETLEVDMSVKGDIILSRTQHNLQIVSVTEPTKFAGCLVYISDIGHMNDFLGDTDMDASEKSIDVQIKALTEKGEVIGVNKANVKDNNKKRSRTTSKSEGERKEKRRRTDSITSNADSKKENLPDIKQPKSLLKLFGQETKPDNKASVKVKTEPKKKKDRAVVVPEVTDTKMEVEEATVKPEEAMPDNVEKISDPGWDFSLTGVTLPAWGKVSIWGDEEESDLDEDSDKNDKEKKHISKKEAKRLRREEEKAAEMQEDKIIQGANAPPQTEQEFEKLVASSPNSSLVWIQFMAHYLQSCQYDQARAVAKRAVDRINFREENERLNIYLAWLNLENAYGTQESLDTVLRDAVQRNDEYKVYSQMADIFNKSSKFLEAEKIYKTLAKKFCKVKEVWIRYGLFYFTNSRMEEGRFVFTRALQNLEAREAADISAKFAQIEFKYGDTERGKTMYEKLVSSYPRRVDIWSSYADQLTRIGDVTATRALYTRISTLGLQAKKMKPLFAKWLEFETSYGTDEQQGEVRSAALKYLNSKTSEEPADAQS